MSAGQPLIDRRLTQMSHIAAASTFGLGFYLTWRCAERLSAKIGRRHPLGGILGEAEYEGRLAEFVPYLAAA